MDEKLLRSDKNGFLYNIVRVAIFQVLHDKVMLLMREHYEYETTKVQGKGQW